MLEFEELQNLLCSTDRTDSESHIRERYNTLKNNLDAHIKSLSNNQKLKSFEKTLDVLRSDKNKSPYCEMLISCILKTNNNEAFLKYAAEVLNESSTGKKILSSNADVIF